MKFDFAIGNPPFQDDKDNNPRKPPVYHLFMDAAFDVSDVVELITPGRFLYDAGQTPKPWNNKMLNDEHFKVLSYEPLGEKIFQNTEIKGGIAISIHDTKKVFGAIRTFSSLPLLNTIQQKISNYYIGHYQCMDVITSSRGHYRFSKSFFDDYPQAKECLSSGTGNMLASNVFDKNFDAFKTVDGLSKDFLKILGRTNNERVYKSISRKYIQDNDYIGTYNVIITEANGKGSFGEVLSTPLVIEPDCITNDTFISIGLFDKRQDAEAALKYIKTKFARAMLGLKKSTQHTSKSVWSMVPLQDFTANSDINWNKTIQNIDQQLYKKYCLSVAEIDFIENNVKEMN